MPTTNYFKCLREPFFFNDKDEGSVDRAFRSALVHQATHQHRDAVNNVRLPPIAVLRRPLLSGDWDGAEPILG